MSEVNGYWISTPYYDGSFFAWDVVSDSLNGSNVNDSSNNGVRPVMTLLSELFAQPLASIFVSYDKDLLELTVNAIRLYSLFYIISWFNIYASSLFTALNNGFVSALISFLRTLLFQVVVILILPELIGINGIWLSVLVAEILSLIVSIICFITNKKKYEYV